MRGDAHNPLLVARVRGSDIDFEGMQLQTVSADIDFDPRGNGHADINLQLDHFTSGTRDFSHLGVTTAGNTAAHHYEVDLRAAPYRMQASGQGQYRGWRMARRY